MSVLERCQRCARRAMSWSDGLCSPCANRRPLRVSEVDHERGVITIANEDDAAHFGRGMALTVTEARRSGVAFVAGLVVGVLLALAALWGLA